MKTSLVFAFVCVAVVARAQRMELSDLSASPVIVESADIKSEVTGRIAVTTFDLVFRNPNSRVLEGTFVLPLLDGQSVIRFGLDLNGVVRDAVPVDKVKGRVVFEEIERRRIDPGLLEQTAGNNYRARVFPIPAGGTRRIVVAYQEDVARAAGAPAYRLNLDFPTPLKTFRLGLTAHTGTHETATLRTTLPLELPKWREGKVVTVEERNFTARGLLELTLPLAERPRVLTGRFKADEYFYAEVGLPAGSARPRATPKVVGLIWDSSGSGRERDHEREFALLDAWFTQVRDVEVRLIQLADRASALDRFTVRDGKWSALKRALARTIYDGATALDGLTDDKSVDEWLLFSDGLVNFGVTPAAARLPLHGPIHTILAAPSAHPAWLRGIAARQGGEFVNLLETPLAEAAARLRTESIRVLDVTRDPEAVAQVFPEPGTPLTESTLVVTGVLRQREATLRLRVGHDQRDARDVDVTVHSGENPSELATRGWAVTKLNYLAVSGGSREDIRRTSREFGIVTADTSLIVLENVADYVRYDIAPPPELRAEWDVQRQWSATGRDKSRDEHLEDVVHSFNERVAWWEKEFSHDPPPRDWEYKRKVGRVPAIMNVTPGRSWAPAPPAENNGQRAPVGDDPNVVMLSPFSVSTERDVGFTASSTTAGARMSSGGGAGFAPAGTRPRRAPRSDDDKDVVRLQAWTPNAGYLDRLERAWGEGRYATYLEERADHAREPGFFLDVANFFFDHQEPALALRILSNLAELELEDVPLLRVLAHRLVQAERADLAVPLFERVLALRPDEPQSRRDLALACADLKQFQRAVDLLWEIVAQGWNNRFPEVEIIALTELNAIAATCGQTLDLSRVDPRLRRNLPVQSRVVLTWDANDCDIDLWITDPNGETAKYDHADTFQGGRLSADFRGGYGPEEFVLRRAKPGSYRVKVDYFGDERRNAIGPVTAQVRVISGFGTPQQREQRTMVRLEDRQQTKQVATFKVEGRVKNAQARTGDE